MTVEEAKAALSERQRTIVLDKFIAKYGEEEGKQKFEKRIKKIFSNMARFGYSKISQELFWAIWKRLPVEIQTDCYFATIKDGIKTPEDENHEFLVPLKKSYAKLDFYIPTIKKWIEFDGDFWHNDNNIEKMKKDKTRTKNVKKTLNGIELKRVKESDFRANPDKVITECVDWLIS